MQFRRLFTSGRCSWWGPLAVVSFLTCTPSTLSAQGPVQSLVAAYSFDEGAGTAAADASGRGNTGTIVNAAWTTAGKFGNALTFNGTNASVNISDSASLHLTNGMTLEAWVRPSTISSAWRDVIYKGNDNYFLEATSSNGSLPGAGGTLGSTGRVIYGTAALTANTWAYLAFTYDRATLRLYINGTQVSSQARTGNLATSANPLQIGGDSIYGQYFSGLIDEVRVYNVALTAAQIQGDMNTPVGASATDTQPPTAPATLTATVSGTQINLNWTASTDNVGVTGYFVERCQGVGCTVFGQIATPTTTTYNDTSLGVGSYSYRVRATDAAGNLSSYSNTAIGVLSDTTPPTAPSNLTATVSATQINLSWTASTDNVAVSGYLVERCLGASCSGFAQISTSTSNAYNDVGLGAGNYSYRVRATDSAGNRSLYSNTAGGIIPDTQAPTTPSALTATASGSQINLSWTASTDNVAVTGYLLERCQGASCSGFAQIAAPTTTTYSDAGLTLGSYSYLVRAMDAAGNLSPYSNTASAGITDTQAPTAPSGLTATVSGNQINLSWTASTDNAAVTGYLLERCQGVGCSSFAQVATPTATAYSDPGLAVGSYSYRVRATDLAGNRSLYSNTAGGVIPDTQAPTTPSALTATASGSQINLSWTPSTDNVGVTGYLLERCQGSGCATFAQIATTTSTTYKDTALAAGASYSYQVRASDAAANLSTYSNVATAMTQTTIPGLVSAYSFSEGAGTTVADASGNGNDGTIANAAWTTAGKYGNALVFNGTTARVTINDSATLHLTSAMTLEAWVNPSSVTSAWRDVIYKGDDNYYLEGTSTTSSRPAGGATGGSTVYATAALTANTWAHLAVTYDGATLRLYVNGAQVASQARAGNLTTSTNPLQIGGDSIYGQFFSGIIDEVRVYNVALTAAQIQADMNAPVGNPAPDTQPPTAPGALTAISGGTQINLNWSASTDNVGVAGYLLERCQDLGCGNFQSVQPGPAGTGTTYSDTALTASTSYSYRLRATDSAGNLSAYSNIASATTQSPDTEPPSAPGTLTATAVSGTQVNLSWGAATDNVGVVGYRLERCQGAGCTELTRIANPTGTTYSDTGLAVNTSYSYQVRAQDAAVNLGPGSNIATTTTLSTIPGLVGEYSFNEGSGTNIGDSSGNGNTGVIVNATWNGAGKFGSALSFNGSNALVTIADSVLLH